MNKSLNWMCCGVVSEWIIYAVDAQRVQIKRKMKVALKKKSRRSHRGDKKQRLDKKM